MLRIRCTGLVHRQNFSQSFKRRRQNNKHDHKVKSRRIQCAENMLANVSRAHMSMPSSKRLNIFTFHPTDIKVRLKNNFPFHKRDVEYPTDTNTLTLRIYYDGSYGRV